MAISYELELRIAQNIHTREQVDELIALLNTIVPLTPAANEAPLAITADVTYDETQLQAVADKVDAVIAALVAAGLMQE